MNHVALNRCTTDSCKARENVCNQRYGNLNFARDWLKTLHECSDWLECDSSLFFKMYRVLRKWKIKTSTVPIRNLWQIGQCKTNTLKRFVLGSDVIWPRGHWRPGSLATQSQSQVHTQAQKQTIGMTQVKTKFDPNTRTSLDPVFSVAKYNHVW